MPFLHTKLAQGRWFQFSLMEQLGNIGSEVGRAIQFRRRGDDRRSGQALYRALDLFDLTIADPRLYMRPALKELLRVRECLCDSFFGENLYEITDDSWERYFLAFALAARKNR